MDLSAISQETLSTLISQRSSVPARPVVVDEPIARLTRSGEAETLNRSPSISPVPAARKSESVIVQVVGANR